MSAWKMSCHRNCARSATPSLIALSRLSWTSLPSSSTPTPVAPNSRAAAMTSRPSPLPRSYTISAGPTSASRSISTPTPSGVATYGMDGPTNPGPHPASPAAKASMVKRIKVARVVIAAPMFERGLRPRNLVLGEASEGAVEAPSDLKSAASGEVALPEAEGLRRDLEQLVFPDPFQRLLQVHDPG